ncbi:MAG: hypothetical protein ACEPOW_14455, partial [Bacteroidales bacterium]
AIVSQGYMFFGSWLRYFPFVSGIILALVQFVPEFQQKRLKISLHLPMKVNDIFRSMLFYGNLSLFAVFILPLSLLSLITLMYFPLEILYATLLTVIPWFFGGFVTYSYLSMVIVEPSWKFKIIYLILMLGVVYFFQFYSAYGIYKDSIWSLIGLMILLSCSILYSGNRFKRGEM